MSSREESSYRTAEALISVAAKDAEQKARVAKRRSKASSFSCGTSHARMLAF